MFSLRISNWDKDKGSVIIMARFWLHCHDELPLWMHLLSANERKRLHRTASIQSVFILGFFREIPRNVLSINFSLILSKNHPLLLKMTIVRFRFFFKSERHSFFTRLSKIFKHNFFLFQLLSRSLSPVWHRVRIPSWKTRRKIEFRKFDCEMFDWEMWYSFIVVNSFIFLK